MCHRHIPFVAILLAALFSVAADKPKEPVPSAAQIQQWVKQLGDDDFKLREEATRDLLKAGGAAFDAVRMAKSSDDPEVKQRALRIIKHHENVAITYFKKLGGKVTVDEKSPCKPVIGLNLSETKVTDAGLVHLKGLADLRWLYLAETKIADISLLKGLTNLKSLKMDHTSVTDLSSLKGLKNLEDLRFSGTQVSDLVPLKGLTNLKTLILSNTQVKDLTPLKGLTNMERLFLSKPFEKGLVPIKDLSPLAGLTNLKMLYLSSTIVTKEEIHKLRKALPKCEIIWDDE